MLATILRNTSKLRVNILSLINSIGSHLSIRFYLHPQDIGKDKGEISLMRDREISAQSQKNIGLHQYQAQTFTNSLTNTTLKLGT